MSLVRACRLGALMLSLVACGGEEIMGYKVDLQRQCVAKKKSVAAKEEPPGSAFCENKATSAEAPDGTCWVFPNTCYPFSFSLPGTGSTCELAHAFPACD